MALITCGGLDALDGPIHMPGRGPWFAKLRLDGAVAPSGKVSIVADGGISLSGFVAVGGVFTDVAHVHVVGGAGGLGKTMKPAAYQNAQLRDPLNAVMSMAGESLSSSVAPAVLAVQLPAWTIVASTAARALDELCGAAGAALGQAITWRILGDGTVWLGAEAWPAQSIPAGSDLLDAFPAEGRYVIGADTPWLMPGVALEGVGNVAAVDHWLTAYEIRSWAWT